VLQEIIEGKELGLKSIINLAKKQEEEGLNICTYPQQKQDPQFPFIKVMEVS
jgi:hypothetical protein